MSRICMDIYTPIGGNLREWNDTIDLLICTYILRGRGSWSLEG
jgi:hypothetical protein